MAVPTRVRAQARACPRGSTSSTSRRASLSDSRCLRDVYRFSHVQSSGRASPLRPRGARVGDELRVELTRELSFRGRNSAASRHARADAQHAHLSQSAIGIRLDVGGIVGRWGRAGERGPRTGARRRSIGSLGRRADRRRRSIRSPRRRIGSRRSSTGKQRRRVSSQRPPHGLAEPMNQRAIRGQRPDVRMRLPAKPTNRRGKPTDRRAKRVIAADRPTREAGDLARCADRPTSEAGDLARRADRPTREAGDLARRADRPTREAGDLARHADRPTREAGDLARRADRPTREAGDLARHADRPTREAGELAGWPTDRHAKPVNLPDTPTDRRAKPVNLPDTPTDRRAKPMTLPDTLSPLGRLQLRIRGAPTSDRHRAAALPTTGFAVFCTG